MVLGFLIFNLAAPIDSTPKAPAHMSSSDFSAHNSEKFASPRNLSDKNLVQNNNNNSSKNLSMTFGPQGATQNSSSKSFFAKREETQYECYSIFASDQNYLLFSSFYNHLANDHQKAERSQALFRKIKHDVTYQREFSESYSTEVKHRSQVFLDSVPEFSSFSLSDTSFDKRSDSMISMQGSFRILPRNLGSYFITQHKTAHPGCVVIWKTFGQSCYVLLCEEDENKFLAQNFLSVFTKSMDEMFKTKNVATNPKELFVTRMEDFIVFLDHFLPNGLLLFMNEQLIKQLKKKIELILSK